MRITLHNEDSMYNEDNGSNKHKRKDKTVTRKTRKKRSTYHTYFRGAAPSPRLVPIGRKNGPWVGQPQSTKHECPLRTYGLRP